MNSAGAGRGFWYSVSSQCLTALCTDGAVRTLPWRLANAHHLWLSARSSAVGRDFYGRPTDALWFAIPPRHRGGVVLLLLASTFAQLANQTSRGVYSSFETQDRHPGSLWTTLFFMVSLGCAITGAAYQQMQEGDSIA